MRDVNNSAKTDLDDSVDFSLGDSSSLSNSSSPSYFKAFIKGILKENPVFRLALGMCATLAVSTSATGALGMGLATAFVLLFSNIAISLLRNIIPSKVRLPAYIVIIATFTTIVELLLKAHLPEIDKLLGIYLPLIAVNCIIFGRAEAFASKNKTFLSALDGLGMGIGFTLALVSLGIVREFLGKGTVFGISSPLDFKISFFIFPAGGFFVFGMLIWLINGLTRLIKREDSRKIISSQVCAACPHADSCTSYNEQDICEDKSDHDIRESEVTKK